ncbi:MAG: SAM-dependent methyltransferase [Pseudomonadota bacterium]
MYPSDEQLVVVGTGLRTTGQLTTEAAAWIKRADRVLYVITDPVAETITRSMNPRCESLANLYSSDKNRMRTYDAMVERVLEVVRSGAVTCFAAYGHPGIFAYPTHEAIRRAKREGFNARMLPGISAEDCLFADLAIDPASCGCSSFEASDFLLNRRIHDPTSHLVLWQIGVLGEPKGLLNKAKPRGLPLLVDKLKASYPQDHPVKLYLAPMFPAMDAQITTIPLRELTTAEFSVMTTLYIPPHGTPDTNWQLVEEFGFDVQSG